MPYFELYKLKTKPNMTCIFFVLACIGCKNVRPQRRLQKFSPVQFWNCLSKRWVDIGLWLRPSMDQYLSTKLLHKLSYLVIDSIFRWILPTALKFFLTATVWYLVWIFLAPWSSCPVSVVLDATAVQLLITPKTWEKKLNMEEQGWTDWRPTFDQPCGHYLASKVISDWLLPWNLNLFSQLQWGFLNSASQVCTWDYFFLHPLWLVQ